jgi:hypothetical protein
MNMIRDAADASNPNPNPNPKAGRADMAEATAKSVSFGANKLSRPMLFLIPPVYLWLFENDGEAMMDENVSISWGWLFIRSDALSMLMGAEVASTSSELNSMLRQWLLIELLRGALAGPVIVHLLALKKLLVFDFWIWLVPACHNTSCHSSFWAAFNC